MIEYTDSDAFPESVDILGNSDAPDAGTINVPLEAVLDRTRWLKNHACHVQRVLYTGSGATGVTPPARARSAIVFMFPPGGGGGGGAGGSNTTHKGACSGGGGGGGHPSVECISIDPALTYDIVPGVGGNGGTGGTGGASPTAGTDGSDGGSSYVRDSALATKCQAYGGTGGKGGVNVTDVSPFNTVFGIAPGGLPAGGGGFRPGSHLTYDPVRTYTEGPHSGGEGTGGLSGEFPRGGRNGLGGLRYAGGAAGAKGTDEDATGDTWIPGGGGGGGGGGGWPNSSVAATGGAGGNGGNTGLASPSGVNGSAGASPTGNRGGGGGGGGGGGKSGNGGNGGKGDDGRIVMLWIIEEEGM